MPPYSTIKTFVRALQTGRTNITEALDRLLTNPGRHQGHPHFNDFSSQGALNGRLPDWLRQLLRAEGMSEPELNHLDGWPDDQKELVRAKLTAAIQDDRRVHFFWELYDGAAPVNDIRDPDATGDISIIFRSPRGGVKLSSVTFGDISVEA